MPVYFVSVFRRRPSDLRNVSYSSIATVRLRTTGFCRRLENMPSAILRSRRRARSWANFLLDVFNDCRQCAPFCVKLAVHVLFLPRRRIVTWSPIWIVSFSVWLIGLPLGSVKNQLEGAIAPDQVVFAALTEGP